MTFKQAISGITAAGIAVVAGIGIGTTWDEDQHTITVSSDTTYVYAISDSARPPKKRIVTPGGTGYMIDVDAKTDKMVFADIAITGDTLKTYTDKDVRIDTVRMKPKRTMRYQSPYVIAQGDTINVLVNYAVGGKKISAVIPYVISQPVKNGCALSLVLQGYFDEGKAQ